MKKISTLFMLFVLLALSANAFATQVSMPTNITANAAAAVDIPVNIDTAAGVAAYQITVTYNASVLNCTTVEKGSLISTGWDAMTINAQSGQIFGSTNSSDLSELGSVSGTLALIRCTAVGSPGASTSLHFSPSPATALVNGLGDPIISTFVDGTFTINGGQCTPSTEVCDGIDNDCDGQVDEGLTRSTTCGIGACAATGTETCTAGAWGGNTCTPGQAGTEGPAGNAKCSDQIDNDCDGSTDSADQDCGGQCTPSTEVCDGIDNDCDGQVDEDLTRSTTCGIGACATTGTETCTAGAWGGNTCTPGQAGTEGPAGNATCSDQIDNDCDGSTDSADQGCGGQCVPSTEVCDGVDNDCDGQVDEDIAAIPTTCGIGACAATGQSTCQGGQTVDSCTPGQAGTEGPFGDATCSDQIDNDCDGTTDAADSSCQGTQSGMGQWVGTWFSVKGTLKGSTFRTPDSKFLADRDSGNGYIHIWSWDPDTKELHYDYYEYIKNEGKWESYTEKLHFFAGTDLKFLFSYNNTAENFMNAFTGVIEGKVQKGILKSATIKSLGGYYTEVYDDNTMYSTGLQTVTGKMINESKVPVPAEVRIQH